MMLSKQLPMALAASLFLVSGGLQAATDGTQGTTSSGSADITVTKQSEVKISGLADIALDVQADGSATGSTGACIYRNGSGSYTVTANSGNGSGDFRLKDTSDNVMVYTVSFNDGTNTTALTEGTALTGQTNANTITPTCNGGSNATIEVTVSQTEFNGAPAGTYTDTLTLLIAPE